MAGEGALPLNPAEIAHGQMFIGFFINVLLCGIMITQVYLYGVTYKKDPIWIKTAVGVIFLADLMQTGFLFAYLYRSLIVRYGFPEALGEADWLFGTDPALTGLIAMAVQGFFAWRVKVLTKTWIAAGVIGVLAVAGGVAGVWTAVEVGRTPTFVEFQNFKATVIVWLAAEALCDVLITTILVWYLVSNILLAMSVQRKHKTGFSQSDLVVDRIIRLTMQTGLLTMVVATLDLIFFLIDVRQVPSMIAAEPSLTFISSISLYAATLLLFCLYDQPKGTHLIFNFPLAKLYTNSLMSSLNSRKGWNFSVKNQTGLDTESNGVITTGAMTKPTMSVTAIKSTGGVQVGVSSRPEIYVHVESHELRDVPEGGHGRRVAMNPTHKVGDGSSQSSLEANEKGRWNHPYYTS